MQNPVTSFAIMVLACLLEIFVLASYFALTGAFASGGAILLRPLFIEALLALVVSPLIFPLLDAYVPPVPRQKAHAAE